MKPIYRQSSFLLDRIKDTDPEQARVRFRIRWGQYQAAFNCKVVVDVDKWSMDAQRCTRNALHGKKRISSAAINSELDNIERQVELAFSDFEMREEYPTAEELRAKVNLFLGRKSQAAPEKATYDHIVNEYLVEGERFKGWAHNTIISTNSVLMNVKRMYPNIRIEDITAEWYQDFVSKMLNSGKNNRTVSSYNNHIRTFITWCVKKKYIASRSVLDDSPVIKRVPKTVVYLTKEELVKFYNYDFGHVCNVFRDAYCMSAFTSLRFSDITQMRIHNVYDGVIHLVIKKTSVPIDIELNKYSRAIFEKYSAGKKPDAKLFPFLDSGKVNMALRGMFKTCGFKEPVNTSSFKNNKRIDSVVPKYELLTFHSARKTFVCNMLSLGVAPNVVMKFTGHSDYASMKPYIAITSDAKKEAMAVLDSI